MMNVFDDPQLRTNDAACLRVTFDTCFILISFDLILDDYTYALLTLDVWLWAQRHTYPSYTLA
jgi:hypothetical protein